MEKTRYKKLSGSQNLRQQLVLSTLTFTPIQIPDIRTNETWPGLREYEVSLVKVLALVCHAMAVLSKSTTLCVWVGTGFKFKPGIVMGRLKLEHDCGFERSIGYFLEPLILLGLFAKKPITITVKGFTNDSKDPSIDTFRSTTFPILKRYGVPSEGLELEIKSGGCAPKGGGEVVGAIPVVQSLTGVTWTDEGLVKRIRGVTFSMRVSVQFENTMVHAARGVFHPFLPDVHIFTDHRAGPQAGEYFSIQILLMSHGYGMSIVAETTSGCC